ncbi:MAG TPA: phage holin family protein [Isosphaeraceae bacterium]|jgi:hypothetical protein|nr:phage holin family protein [Isosphaeraceae bacterium]
MADQATVNVGNGRGVPINAPTEAVVGGVADFGNDLATLVELQAKLIAIDLKVAVDRATMPLVVAAVGAVLALGALPVVLLGVAELLVQYAGLPRGWAYLLVGGLAIVLAAVAAWLMLPRLKASLESFRRSREELTRNVSWIRTVLVRSGKLRPRR